MKGARALAGSSAVAAAGLLLLLLGLCAAAADGDARHNVLELFPTARLRHSAVGRRSKGAITITYNNTQLTGSGEWVEVHVRGVPSPQPTDLLAVYAPPDAYAAGLAPVKFANATDAPGYLEHGAGSHLLRLVNVRADMRVVLVRGGDSQPEVAAVGPVLRNVAPNQPTGIHLMRTRSPTEVLVQWTTRDAGRPLVRYGRSPAALDFAAPAASATYTAADMCGEPATTYGFLPPGQLHTAVLSGLEPGAAYAYQVGDAGPGGQWSRVFEFFSPPVPGPEQTVHILALADQGVGEPDGSYAAMEFQPGLDVALRVTADAATGPPGGGHYSLVLHAGDIAYARGYSALWDAFLYQQQELAARVPYMVAIGNHERDWVDHRPYPTIDSGGECGVPYTARWPMPTSGQREQPWYSFEHGPLHITVMSTEHQYGPGSAQHAWLGADLAGVDRARTPWLVLMGHRPHYIDAEDYGEQGKQTSAEQLQAALEHLLDAHGVDLALAGHHHSYQRTCSVFRGECHERRERGTVYLTVGHAGAAVYNNGAVPTPAWIAYEDQLSHGHARLHANATHLCIEAVDAATGKVVDEAVLGPRRRRSAAEHVGLLLGARPLAAAAAAAA